MRCRGWSSVGLMWAFVLAAVVGQAASLRAADPAASKSAAEILPASTVLYAEVTHPKALIASVQQHPLRKTLAGLPEYKALTEDNPEYLKAVAGLGLVEFALGKKWHEAFSDLAGDGLYVGVDGKTKGVIMLARAPDAAALSKMKDKIIKLARDDAKRKGNDDPVKEDTYRDHTFYQGDKIVFGTFHRWLVISNKPETAKGVADQLLDGGSATLAGNERFVAAKKLLTGEPVVWAWADVQTLREAGAAKDLYKDKIDNPGAELLIGGILATLKTAKFAAAGLYLKDDGLSLTLSVPHDRDAIPEHRRHYFGADGKGSAAAPLAAKNRLLAISVYRDVGQMWQRRSDIFDENVNAKLAEADSNLTTVFAGLAFGREVLGGLGPQMQVISVAQNFEGRERVPKIKIPATALVFQLKEPDKMKRQFKVSFQSLIGLVNLGAGQQKLPQLELKTEDIEGGQMISAGYDSLDKDQAEVTNDIIYNFSPSIAFVGDYFVVSSTRELASELGGLVRKGETQSASEGEVINTQSTLDANVLRELLAANREPLIAQNMLEKGHNRQAAEKEIGGLLSLLKLFKDAHLQLATTDDALRLEVGVDFAK